MKLEGLLTHTDNNSPENNTWWSNNS